MPQYTFKFTPIESFFFGSEKHEINSDGEPESNYFVESNLYPQQTTLLGAIRFFLLQNAGSATFDKNKIQSKILATELIGAESFSYSEKIQDFGTIKKLGSLYFKKGNEDFFFAPLDNSCSISENMTLEKNQETYTAKHHANFIHQSIISKDSSEKIECIIEDAIQVGNQKNNKIDKEKAFYKQTLKTMEDGWSFAIDVELDLVLGKKVAFVNLGGEKSIFKLEIESIEAFAEPDLKKFNRNIPYLFFYSDCFLNLDSVPSPDLAVAEGVSFRNLISKVKSTEKYGGLSAKDDLKLKRSSRFNLIKRGSIMYFKDASILEKIEKSITSDFNAINIGFNKIIVKK
jgi:CRISPR-associated protein Cmr3